MLFFYLNSYVSDILKVEQIAVLTSQGEIVFFKGMKWDRNIFISVHVLY